MPRNASGTYSLPLPPVQPDTTIESTWANSTNDDLAQAVTDSLSRTGQGGMTAPLRFVDGAVGAPGFAWQTETTTGFYRPSAGVQSAVVQGQPVTTWNANGATVPTGKKLTLVDLPSAGTDAANKAYVDSVAAGGVAVSSGTYTPTITATGNITVPSASSAQWMRVGNVVTVSGSCFVIVTTAGLAASFRLSLPVASAFATVTQCGGVAAENVAGGPNNVFGISANIANDQANAAGTPPDNGSTNLSYTYTYSVL
jgi:hypothetical protein